jgi:hypothetical protein
MPLPYMLSYSNLTEKNGLGENGDKLREMIFFIFKKANLERGPEGVFVNMLRKKTRPKLASPAHYEI